MGGGVDSTPPPCFLAFSCSFNQSEQHFQRAFFILSPTSCQNLRFSSKMPKTVIYGCQNRSKRIYFQNFWKIWISRSQSSWNRHNILKKKISNFYHNFLKLVLGVTKNVKKISCFYIVLSILSQHANLAEKR